MSQITSLDRYFQTLNKSRIVRCIEMTQDDRRCKLKFDQDRGVYCHIHRKNDLYEIGNKNLNDFRDLSRGEYLENSFIAMFLFVIYFIFYFWINFWFLV